MTLTHDKEVLQSLENLSKWFGKRHNIEWRELMSEAWIRMEIYGTNFPSVAVRQAAHAYIRREVKHSTLSLDMVSVDFEDGDKVPAWFPVTIDQHDIEWVDLFERSTRSLSDVHRQALYLWVIGTTSEEIGRQLNVSTAVAKVLVSRAKARIRQPASTS